MENFNYLETLLKNNNGVFISEKDYSSYSVTQNYNRISFVIGSSKIGTSNLPILCTSPENFEEIYGKQDYSLERRNSFFHRTVKDMLIKSPVLCLNLRPWDNDLDKYNWINLSTSSDKWNSPKKLNSIQDFYNTSNGLWKRSSDDFLDVVKNNTETADTNPLSFCYQKDRKVSILVFKSEIGGFDIPVEDWYKNDYPTYLHPKDFISDYIVQVLIVEGDWDNYEVLSQDTVYGKYFNKTGIKKNKIEEFLSLPSIVLIKRWNCSLIPYFKDKNDNDLWIESVINKDVNETGLFCTYDNNIIDTEYKNGFIDLLGDNLTFNKKPQIDFLSYKRYMTDFYILEETLLDTPNNAFGNTSFNNQGRTQIYSEGYIAGVKMKPLIISTTSSIGIKPFEVEQDAYGIINGKKIEITSDITDYLALNNILVPNAHRAYLILLTSSGIEFRLGNITPLEQILFLPQIKQNEIVIAYYELIQDSSSNYISNLFPIVVGINGYINPIGNEISFIPTSYNWLQQIYFNNIYSPTPQNYREQYINHLYTWLSKNMSQDKSLVIDNDGNKQPVKWIEKGDDKIGRWLKIAIKDYNSDITSNEPLFSYYMEDIEFLAKNNRWDYNKPPLTMGTDGIIGYESFIKESYLKGYINSGDPFFWSFSEETMVEFYYDNNIKQNLIIIPNTDYVYTQKRIIVEGSVYNDGIFNILNTIIYGDNSALVVQENVENEEVEKITLYDAEKPFIINIYDTNGYETALIDIWSGDPQELYKRLIKTKDVNAVWKKTLQIKSIKKENEIIVDWETYFSVLEKGFFLLSNRKTISGDDKELRRNWTRIMDLQRLNDTDLLIITDSPVRWRMIDNIMETDILQPIWKWVDTLDFKVLDGFKPREDVLPNGTDIRMKEILSLISNNSYMQKSLCTEKYEWRYLIDSYGGGLYSNSKQELVDIVEQKQFALGFINAPSIKEFKKDNTKYKTKGKFDTQKLLNGGDRKMNTGEGYLPVTSSHVSYLTPWVSVSEHGRFFIVPPASHVGQIYMNKHNVDSIKIWDAMAGIDVSQLTTINGLEERFSDEELNDLHNYGLSCITNYNNEIFYMFNEKTSMLENSILRYIHNRESLIELELSLHKALTELQWTHIILLNNKTKKDVEKISNSICEYYKKLNGISSYTNEFVINNELIDAQIGLLNTNVELNGVMQTILYKVSIFKTGTISITKQ